MRESRAAAWAMRARSCASCTDADESSAKPVERVAITSLWSPKMESAWVATARAVTWKTAGVSSPAILNMFGIIRSRPWLAVKVVARLPPCKAPCTAPAAPPSDCISMTVGTAPQRFVRPSEDQASAFSAMLDDGVIG